MKIALLGGNFLTPPFFIVGTGRCGTHLLYDILSLHPEINICLETHFLPKLYDIYGLDEITFQDYYSVVEKHYDARGNKWIHNILKSEGKQKEGFKQRLYRHCGKNGEATIVDFTECLYSYLYGSNCLIGDKTPNYGLIMTTLKKMWSGAKFIHMVRNGVYTAESMSRHLGFKKFINSGIPVTELDRSSYKGRIIEFSSDSVTLREAARFWDEIINKILEEKKFIPQTDYLEVKYEKLFREPENTLNKISRFLGVRPYDTFLKKAVLVSKPFYLRRTKNRITRQEYQEIYSEIDDTMKKLGYDIHSHDYEKISLKEVRRAVIYYLRSSINNFTSIRRKILNEMSNDS